MIKLKEELIYLNNYLRRETPEITKTLEGLSAQRAYNSLTEEERKEYAPYSSSLDPAFFKVDLNWVERILPPYPLVVQKWYKNSGISEEELEILKQKNSIKKKG